MKEILLAILALASQSLLAINPETGLWWNANESGRGFNIELQDNTMVITGYVFNSNGTQLWFLSAGPYNQTTNTFTGPMTSFTGGQCITCTYRPATAVTPSLGNMTINFPTTSTATMTWPGGTVALKRTIYGVAENIEKLRGLWTFSAGEFSSGLYSGEWINLTPKSITDPTLGAVIQGSIQGGRVAVAARNAAGTEFIVLVDSSTSYYHLYRIQTEYLGTREALGLWWIYLKTSQPTGTGTLAFGNKVIAPPVSATKRENSSFKASNDLNLDDQIYAKTKTDDSAPVEVVEMADKLKGNVARWKKLNLAASMEYGKKDIGTDARPSGIRIS
jgi:hypothetical protein